MRVAVNGFGRIGRLVTRILMTEMPDVRIVAINDPATIEMQAYLLEYDSCYGRFPLTVAGQPGGDDRPDRLIVDGVPIPIWHTRDPHQTPWRDLAVDLVIDATGKLRKRADLDKHLAAGARRVLVSAPSNGADVTLVYGVNEALFDPEHHHVVSSASCTTNAATALLAALDRAWRVEYGFVTTVHAYTNSQSLVDRGAVRGEMRDGRAAALNIVPSATGAASAVGQILPHLRDRIDGIAFRVPVATVSLLDLTVFVDYWPTVADMVELFEREANDPKRRSTIGTTAAPLVSSDLRGHPASAIVSLPDLRAQGQLLKVIAWYDNEWGFSCRLVDLARHILAHGGADRNRALASHQPNDHPAAAPSSMGVGETGTTHVDAPSPPGAGHASGGGAMPGLPTADGAGRGRLHELPSAPVARRRDAHPLHRLPTADPCGGAPLPPLRHDGRTPPGPPLGEPARDE